MPILYDAGYKEKLKIGKWTVNHLANLIIDYTITIGSKPILQQSILEN